MAAWRLPISLASPYYLCLVYIQSYELKDDMDVDMHSIPLDATCLARFMLLASPAQSAPP
jgi:hypothetical protein